VLALTVAIWYQLLVLFIERSILKPLSLLLLSRHVSLIVPHRLEALKALGAAKAGQAPVRELLNLQAPMVSENALR